MCETDKNKPATDDFFDRLDNLGLIAYINYLGHLEEEYMKFRDREEPITDDQIITHLDCNLEFHLNCESYSRKDLISIIHNTQLLLPMFMEIRILQLKADLQKLQVNLEVKQAV